MTTIPKEEEPIPIEERPGDALAAARQVERAFFDPRVSEADLDKAMLVLSRALAQAPIETPNELAERLVMLVGRLTAIDLCAIAPSVVEDPPGKRDLHHRLTEVTDQVLGYAPTMPIDALVERLEKAVPRLTALIILDEGKEDETTPRPERPFNNDDPNDGSFKRFTCECGTCIEVTPTWRSLHNDAWWIETFCSEKCGWKSRGTTLLTWAEDATKR